MLDLKEILEIVACPSCQASDMGIGSGRYAALECRSCRATYPVVDGILDLAPRLEGGAIRPYRTESLYDMIARWYDLAGPAMSMLVWNCPPLRYVDWTHRAVGRASGGRLLVEPVGTGLLLDHVQSPHTHFPMVAVDISWKMLRRARQRFDASGAEHIQLVRAEPERLPFVAGAFRAVMSMNGLNGFTDRRRALAEMARVLEPGGLVTGSSLCRGLERPADFVLNQYERWGIYPILRSRDYLVRELREAFGGVEVQFETHGAVVFFSAEPPASAAAAAPEGDAPPVTAR